MGRAGAFSANFDPDNLDAFRSFCGGRGEKYTKVLEQLALAYIESNGELLPAASGPASDTRSQPTSTTPNLAAAKSDLHKRISRLEETIFQRLESVEKITNSGRFKK
jgi:hypothetical protein